jgi:hypothetical protein
LDEEVMRTLPLADELFLIGHDEYTGKSIVNAELLDTGLAGAVLGELLLDDRIIVDEGRVSIRDPRPIGESVTDAALVEIRKQQETHPVRAWVEYLRDEVREVVGRRVIATGLVRREQSRALLRTVVRFPAVDTVAAAGPKVRVRYILERAETIDLHTATLAVLVRTTRLEASLVLDPARGDPIAEVLAGLPPDIRMLVTGVDAAVAAIALTIRR